jgi:hypothetical protein
MTFEELKQEFIDNGFQVDGDIFVNVFEDPNTVINGVHPQKKLEMVYIGDGYVMDAGDSDSESGDILYQFNILNQKKECVLTIGISNFEDFKVLVG